MSSYSEGFKIGYSTNAPLGGISEGIKMFTQEYRKQQEIGRQRQEAFDKARKEFKQKQEDTYGKFYREDLYDNTGITDFDSLGDKFTRGALDLYEVNEFAFRNGFITESDLNARNNNIKAQSQKLTKLYENANKFLEEKKKIDDEGNANPLNDLKLEILEEFSKNVKVTPGLDGLYLSTIGKEGKQRNISVSEFDKILNSESGIDVESIYDNLLKNQGFTQKLESGKKITEFITDKDNDMTALDAQLLTMTEGQQLGALLSIRDAKGNKIATTDEKEAKEKGIIYVGADRIIDPSITKEEQAALKGGMITQLRAIQTRKRKEEIYNDPNSRTTPTQRVKADNARAAYEIAEKIGEGGEEADRLIESVVANNSSIENMFYNQQKDSWVIEKIDGKGTRSDATVKVPRNKDGSVDSRNLGVSLMAAISPSYNVEQAELAARDFEKKNPDYNFANKIDLFDRNYIPLPSLSSLEVETNKFADEAITSTDPDDLVNQIPRALNYLGIDRGYKIEVIERDRTIGKLPISTITGLIPSVGILPTTKKVIRIKIPNISEPIYIDTKNKKEVIDMIPEIGYKIKQSGNLIDNTSRSSTQVTSETGKKQLPTG